MSPSSVLVVISLVYIGLFTSCWFLENQTAKPFSPCTQKEAKKFCLKKEREVLGFNTGAQKSFLGGLLSSKSNAIYIFKG